MIAAGLLLPGWLARPGVLDFPAMNDNRCTLAGLLLLGTKDPT
jgi:hypothetical protein